MSREKRKSGCIGTIAKLFVSLFVIGAIAAVVMPKSESESTEETEPEEQNTKERAQEDQAFVASREAGYGDGFIVGQARHNNKEQGLDQARINLLSRVNSESHAEGGQGRSVAAYQEGWKQGYADGFAGKAKGGGEQKPLPEFPITVSRDPQYSYKNLNDCKANEPLEQLAKLVKDSAKDLFIVDAKVILNENSTEIIRVLYDRKERIYLKLSRLILLGEESSAEWVLKIDLEAEELNEAKLWDSDAKHRTVRSKYNEARNTVPLTYAKNPKFTEWP